MLIHVFSSAAHPLVQDPDLGQDHGRHLTHQLAVVHRLRALTVVLLSRGHVQGHIQGRTPEARADHRHPGRNQAAASPQNLDQGEFGSISLALLFKKKQQTNKNHLEESGKLIHVDHRIRQGEPGLPTI